MVRIAKKISLNVFFENQTKACIECRRTMEMDEILSAVIQTGSFDFVKDILDTYGQRDNLMAYLPKVSPQVFYDLLLKTIMSKIDEKEVVEDGAEFIKNLVTSYEELQGTYIFVPGQQRPVKNIFTEAWETNDFSIKNLWNLVGQRIDPGFNPISDEQELYVQFGDQKPCWDDNAVYGHETEETNMNIETIGIETPNRKPTPKEVLETLGAFCEEVVPKEADKAWKNICKEFNKIKIKKLF